MKTDEEIKKFFLEIMDPFPSENFQIIKNNDVRGIFEIPHDAYQFIIFELMKKFLNTEQMDICTNGKKLRIEWIYDKNEYGK